MSNQQKTIVLTFDDGLENQYFVATPILRRYGFKATIYVGQWVSGVFPDAPAHCISKGQLVELHEEGFEIANHTMGHPPVTKCSDEQLHEEIGGVEKLLTGIGLPRPMTFAYPNGVWSEDVVNVLCERGYLAARTCEPRATEPGVDNPFAIPAYSVSIGDGMEMFDKALVELTPDRPVVLLYHGLPSVHYPPCGIEPEDFEAQMETLHRKGIRCITMKQYIEEFEGKAK